MQETYTLHGPGPAPGPGRAGAAGGGDIILYYPILSYIILYYHILSNNIRYYHTLSCIIINPPTPCGSRRVEAGLAVLSLLVSLDTK